MQAELLNTMTDHYPECLIAAYADLGTRVSLLTAGPVDAPREALDELCAEAAITLGSLEAPTFGADPCHVAIKMLDHAVFVYMRATEDPTDAYLFMCRPEIDLDGFIKTAQAGLASEG